MKYAIRIPFLLALPGSYVGFSILGFGLGMSGVSGHAALELLFPLSWISAVAAALYGIMFAHKFKRMKLYIVLGIAWLPHTAPLLVFVIPFLLFLPWGGRAKKMIK